MTSQQPIDEQERNRLIDAYKDKPDFLKKIFEGNTQKKVDNFLRENQGVMDFMQEIPGYIDPRTGKVVREDQMMAKLPFPYNPAGLPPNVYEAIQSQYGNKTFGPYDLDKQRTVIDYYKGLGKPL